MNYLKISALLILLVACIYFSYFKYFYFAKNQDIVLSEEFEEYKRKPLDPGGIVVAHSSSLIYEKMSPTKDALGKINLLPDPEEPLVLSYKTSLENNLEYDSIDDILAKLESGEQIEQVSQESSEELEAADEVGETVNPEFKITKLAEETNKLHNLNINSIDTGYKIHLSSASTQKEAREEWQKIQSRHLKYLKNAELVIKNVTSKNGKIIYLILAGHYSSLNQAKLVCKKLTSLKQNCIVTK